MSSAVHLIVDFLKSIGLTVRKSETIPLNSFLDSIFIDRGTLVITDNTSPSNLLHEAGHVAIFPSVYRSLIIGDVDLAAKLMFDDMTTKNEPYDSLLTRAALQASDVEATAWAWAAGKHLNLPENEIILDHEYDGEGAHIRFMLACRQYYGIHGLIHSGFTTREDYPRLKRWLQF